MTPEEQLAKILKQNQNIVFGKTIGTDADGNCTVQTGESSILARSGGQISAGDCVAMKADDGQWYAVSSRQSGTVASKTLFSRKSVRPQDVLPANTKVLFQLEDGIYIGGDRETPLQIYTIPEGFEVQKALISVSGTGEDDWVVQMMLRSVEVMDAYREAQQYESEEDVDIQKSNDNSFFVFYLNNRSAFEDSLRLLTITSENTREIKDVGIKTFRGESPPSFTFTEQAILFSDSLGADNFFFILRESYQVNLGDWSLTPIPDSRTCDIIGSVLLPVPEYDSFVRDEILPLAEMIRAEALASTSLIYTWRDLESITELSPSYKSLLEMRRSNFEFRTGEWLILDVEPTGFGWWYCLDSASLEVTLEPSGLYPEYPEPYSWQSFPEAAFTGYLFSRWESGSYIFASRFLKMQEWIGFAASFDGKTDLSSLPLTLRRLSADSGILISDLTEEESRSEASLQISESRTTLSVAELNQGEEDLEYSYPLNTFGFTDISSPFAPPIVGISYRVSSFESKNFFIRQGVGETHQLVKNNAENAESVDAFSWYLPEGDPLTVTTPFLPTLLNESVVLNVKGIDLDLLEVQVDGYELEEGLTPPPEIEGKKTTVRQLPFDVTILSLNTFLDAEGYNGLDDA